MTLMAIHSGIRLRLLRYVGFVLLAGLVAWAGPAQMLRTLAEAHPGWLALAWVLNLPQLGLKALRWQRLVRWQRIPLSLPRALLAYFSSLMVGFMTPGRLGEMAKAFTLKYEGGVTLARGLSSVVLDRAFDMYLLLVLGGVGVFRYAILGTRLPWPAFAGLCLLLLAPLVFLHAPVARWAGERAARLPGLRRRGDWVREKSGQFAEGLASVTTGRVAVCVVLTLASYAIFFVQCLLCAWALGFTLNYLDLVWMMAATNLLSFLPNTISGIGNREVALTYFLSQATPPQPAAMAVAFGLTIFLVFFVGGGLIGFICWQWAPIGLRRAVGEVRRVKEEG
jgi:uncharacterized protein (TIRG00374 family)